jgi:hypothetical protein
MIGSLWVQFFVFGKEYENMLNPEMARPLWRRKGVLRQAGIELSYREGGYKGD